MNKEKRAPPLGNWELASFNLGGSILRPPKLRTLYLILREKRQRATIFQGAEQSRISSSVRKTTKATWHKDLADCASRPPNRVVPFPPNFLEPGSLDLLLGPPVERLE